MSQRNYFSKLLKDLKLQICCLMILSFFINLTSHIKSFLLLYKVLSKTLYCSAVLDEVDILINDEDFEAALQTLISSSPVTTQYLFVTATLPVDVYNKLVEIFPDCEVVMGPGMHRISRHLEEVSFYSSLFFNTITTTCLFLLLSKFEIKGQLYGK